MKATIEKAFGYQGDTMKLPVPDLAAALPFYGRVAWKVFYVIAPDGLCYWFGERQSG
jgi:hypothetical protein